MKLKNLLTLALLFISLISFGQTTTSSISGEIKDENSQPIFSAVVYAKHEPTGAVFGNTTNEKGYYTINNMSVGGPYSIRISFLGYRDTTFHNIYLSLGEEFKLSLSLLTSSTQLTGVTITGIVDAKEGSISRDQLKTLPTISRNLSDFNKLTPQSSNNSFNGTNFRYNNITLDGSINNDAIGFSPSLGGMSGTSNMPGSSTRTSPVSLDAIQDMQIVIAPYDVKLGNFTGGSINAVTRSGTNTFSGSTYGFGRGAFMTGPDNVGDRSKMPNNYYDYQTGFRVGMPLKKDKLFLFINSEVTERNEPLFYGAGQSGTFMTIALAQRIVDSLQSKTFMPVSKWNPNGSYDPGAYGGYSIFSKSFKFFTRLDWNVSEKSKLSFRSNFIKSSASNLERSVNEFQFGNYDFVQNNTNSSNVLEFKTQFNNKLSNDAIVGFTYIKDWRDLSGDLFPQIQINNVNGGGRILLGSNRESGIFNMGQKTIELTDNLTYLAGKHKLTFGTHNEIYFIDYGFINSYNGRIDYNSMDDFFANKPSRIRATYNLDNNDRDYNFNNPSARFNVNLLSVYTQDDWQITSKFRLSPGIRVDYPMLPNRPSTDPQVFQNTYSDNYSTTYTHTQISDINNNLLGKPMISPRIGFNWDIKDNKKYVVRGGTGLFTGRIPFAWFGYAFYNNGTNYASFDKTSNTSIINIPTDPTTFSEFNSTVLNQKTRTEINLIDNNFKMPQVWRSSLSTDIDIKGYKFTFEGIFTKTIYDVMFKQINLFDSVTYYSYDVNHLQPIYIKNPNGNRRIDDDHTSIFLMTNTNKGYRYSLTAQVKKDYKCGLGFMTAYNYGRSFDMSNGIRNSYESNWQLNQSLSPNNPQLSYSNFYIRHRIITSINYGKVWNEKNKTTVSLFFTTQSGSPYTWVIGSNTLTGNGQQIDLAYIPKSQGEITFKPYTDANGNLVTADQQWQMFNNYVENDEYLRTRRGQFTERNGDRTPWNTQLDLRLIHDVNLKKSNKLQITLDVINLTNLINPNWGWQYFVPNTQNSSAFIGLNPTGTVVNGTPEYKFVQPTSSPYSIDKLASRWQSQIGIRYTF
jgi:hypothetical protein